MDRRMMGTKDGRGKSPDLIKQVKICSWNVWGVKDRSKKQAIFSMAGTGRFKYSACRRHT